jgi:putative restriction endonuclease
MEDIEKKFDSITIWKRGSQRAPHKPLLILLALGHYFNGGGREIPYLYIDQKLKELLIEYGPYRKSYHTEYPFWRLQNDGIWEIEKANNFIIKKNTQDVTKHELLTVSAKGGFPEDLYIRLKNNPNLIQKVAQNILSVHFPETLHEDILQSVGIDVGIQFIKGRKRSLQFREYILKAYEYRCAICGFDIQMVGKPIGLEAAHIKWHQAGGPDIESNGLALCSLHHKLFDRGAFTLSSKLGILVSEYASGGESFEYWLKRFHGQKIKGPQRPTYYPGKNYIEWHLKEVFHGPSRYL